MSFEKIVLVPNTGITHKNNSFFLSSTEVKFLNEVSGSFNETILLGNVFKKDNQFHDKNVEEEIEVVPLNFDKKIEKKKNKIQSLFKLLGFVIGKLNKDYFFYLFLPHTLALFIFPFLILFNKKFGVYVRGDWQRGGSFSKWIYKLAFKRAKFIICTGKHFQNNLSNYNSKVEEVVPMLKIKSFPEDNKNGIAQKNGVLKILYVGRLEYAKGILDLMEAVKTLTQKEKEFELTLVGENRLKEDLKKLKLESPAMFEKIKITGQITDSKKLVEYYSQSDVFVFPSHHEGFPRVLYEAMVYQLPIITTDLPNISAFFDDDSAVIVPIKSPKKLEKAIDALLTDSEKRKTLQINAFEKIKKVYQRYLTSSHGKQVIDNIRNN